MMLFRSDKSLTASLPPKRVMYGVEVSKLNVGRFLQVLQAAENLPAMLLEKLFPEQSAEEILIYFKTNNKKGLLDLITRLLVVAPKELCRLLSSLLSIPQERLLDADCKDGLTPKELTDLLIAFYEVNDLTDFFCNVRRLKSLGARNFGFSAGSPSEKA